MCRLCFAHDVDEYDVLTFIPVAETYTYITYTNLYFQMFYFKMKNYHLITFDLK